MQTHMDRTHDHHHQPGRMEKKQQESSKDGSREEYQAGALSSFLLGSGGEQDHTGGLFSAQAKAKVEPVQPLPGFQDRRGT